MPVKFKPLNVVDLFAGSGGLSEGFSKLKNASGESCFEIVLSIEKDPAAYKTLQLRSFFRQFKVAPPEYYEYLAGTLAREELSKKFPTQWKHSLSEARMLELGTISAKKEIVPILKKLREGTRDTVVIGGPPCQAYSLVGRARNRGVSGYDPAEDDRHFLYEEYINIIRTLKPVAFVMENVKGILSSKVKGKGIFQKILSDLENAAGRKSYDLIPIFPDRDGKPGFVVRAESHGIPQARHRVIIIGVRKDRAGAAALGALGGVFLQTEKNETTVKDVLKDLPRLRSGLSSHDNPKAWQLAAAEGFKLAAKASHKASMVDVAARLDEIHASIIKGRIAPRADTRVSAVKHKALVDWYYDEKLSVLPSHESRSHMPEDLARYAFVATYSEIRGQSPTARDFPDELAPDHANWRSGKFADRFRCQLWSNPSTTITSHIAKDGHYFIHPDPSQCRSLTVREAARLQTFPDNYFFEGNRTQQYTQVGNAVPPMLGFQIALVLFSLLN
jgi:DNA (cytosine-5)-methyltransferase 1